MRFGLWFCRRWGLHALLEGNCTRCGYRWHGGHVSHYAKWAASCVPGEPK